MTTGTGDGPESGMSILRKASRIVYENRWMRVREDEVERADGSAGIYGVVEKDDFSLVVPFDGRSFWLVEQYRYPVSGRYWEFPQGSWEGQGNVAPERLAAAELQQEAGLRAASLIHIGYLYKAYGYCNQGFHVFVARGLEEGATDRSREEQDMTVRLVRVEDFESMIRSGDVRDAASVAAYTLFQLSR